MTSITTYWNSCNVATASSRRLPITLGTVSAVPELTRSVTTELGSTRSPEAEPEQTPGSPAPHRWSQTQHQAEPTQPQAKAHELLPHQDPQRSARRQQHRLACPRRRPQAKRGARQTRTQGQSQARRTAPQSAKTVGKTRFKLVVGIDHSRPLIRHDPNPTAVLRPHDARSKSKRRHPGITERRLR